MLRHRLSTVALLVLLAVLVGDLVIDYPKLPARIASNFDWAGTPNGWMSRQQFLIVTAVLILVFVGMFISVAGIARLPDDKLNLPNKDYWLAPQRRSQTMHMLCEWMRWFLVLTLSVLVLAIVTAVHANLSAVPHFAGSVFVAMLALLCAAPVMIAWLICRLQAKPAA
jgi:serine/threonine-protein kinase